MYVGLVNMFVKKDEIISYVVFDKCNNLYSRSLIPANAELDNGGNRILYGYCGLCGHIVCSY